LFAAALVGCLLLATPSARRAQKPPPLETDILGHCRSSYLGWDPLSGNLKDSFTKLSYFLQSQFIARAALFVVAGAGFEMLYLSGGCFRKLGKEFYPVRALDDRQAAEHKFPEFAASSGVPAAPLRGLGNSSSFGWAQLWKRRFNS
jgi:hypothetical protein